MILISQYSLSHSQTTNQTRISFNTLRPEQNGCHFADNIFKCILFEEKVNFIEFCSLSLITRYITGSYNGLAPNRYQAIAWVNEDIVPWYTLPSLNELIRDLCAKSRKLGHGLVITSHNMPCNVIIYPRLTYPLVAPDTSNFIPK